MATDLGKLIDHLGTVTRADESKTTRDRELATALTAARANVLGDKTSVDDVLWTIVLARLPKFFDDYSQLPGSVKIRELTADDEAIYCASGNRAAVVEVDHEASGGLVRHPRHRLHRWLTDT